MATLVLPKSLPSYASVALSQLQNLPRNPRTCFEGPFGEVLRATGPMAKTNPFRFSTKYQDDETDLLTTAIGIITRAPVASCPVTRLVSRASGLQRVQVVSQPTDVASSSSRWIQRDRPDNENPYLLVGNSPANKVDLLGLIKFEGCEGREDQLQQQFNSFCQKLKDPNFANCLAVASVLERFWRGLRTGAIIQTIHFTASRSSARRATAAHAKEPRLVDSRW